METFTVTTWNLQEKLGWEDQQPGIFEELRRATAEKVGMIVLCDAFREIDTRTGRKTPVGDSLAAVYDFAFQEGFETYWTLYEDEVCDPRYPNLQQNLVALSRLPVLASKPLRLATRNALHLTMEHEGEAVHATAAHYDSRSPFTRMGHTLAYLPHREQVRSGAVLLAGDLNAPHRSDWRARALQSWPAQRFLNSPLVPYYGKRLADQARDPILETLQREAGLQDADPRCTPTMYGPGGFPYIQLDHILHGSALRTVSYTAGNRGPSDHRWVQAELAWAA